MSLDAQQRDSSPDLPEIDIKMADVELVVYSGITGQTARIRLPQFATSVALVTCFNPVYCQC